LSRTAASWRPRRKSASREKKHDPSFPHHAIGYCLQEGKVRLEEFDYVVFYDKPFLKFERLLETYIAFAPRGFRSFNMAVPLWLREKLFQKSLLRRELDKFSAKFDAGRLLFCEHHLSHAASAFFASPYESAAVLTMDGVGEGRPPRPLQAMAISLKSSRRSIFRIRSGSFTPL
jgi:carbamoyltransferase